MATVESHCLLSPEETRGKEWSWSLMRAIAIEEGSPGKRYSHRKTEQLLKQQRGGKGLYIIWSRLLLSDGVSVLPLDQTLFQAKGPK